MWPKPKKCSRSCCVFFFVFRFHFCFFTITVEILFSFNVIFFLPCSQPPQFLGFHRSHLRCAHEKFWPSAPNLTRDSTCFATSYAVGKRLKVKHTRVPCRCRVYNFLVCFRRVELRNTYMSWTRSMAVLLFFFSFFPFFRLHFCSLNRRVFSYLLSLEAVQYSCIRTFEKCPQSVCFAYAQRMRLKGNHL